MSWRCLQQDEPSTGLDPASRRALWDVVRANKSSRAIILTTHSMEEAEQLCGEGGLGLGMIQGLGPTAGEDTDRPSRHALACPAPPQLQPPSRVPSRPEPVGG